MNAIATILQQIREARWAGLGAELPLAGGLAAGRQQGLGKWSWETPGLGTGLGVERQRQLFPEPL